MVSLGNFQINGSAAQKNPLIRYDTFTDVGSLRNARTGTIRILEHFGFGNWSESYIRSRFSLAAQYASQVDGLIFLLQEEIYKPSRTPQTSAGTVQGGYSIEGVNIPSSNEDAYILALLTAWKKMCARLGKKAVICGSPAVCSDDAIWSWMYGAAGVSYIAQNYDMIYLYHYPQTVSASQGATCTQMNGNPGKNDAASYIKFWRGRGFKGLINYILITKFSNWPGSTDMNVIRADFKSANAGADIISTYPYSNGVYSNSDAVGRMLQIAAEYGGSTPPPPTPPPTPGGNMNTILVLGDPHMGEEGNRVAELTKDLNAAVGLSPGQIDCILCTGDLEGVSKFDQAHKASMLGSKPAFIIPGNHDVGSISDIKKYQGTGYPLHPGPAGTEKTSFSFNVGNIHITMLNLYWDGKTNEGYTGGGKSGGEVGSTLLAWLKADLAAATTKYKIVCGHEPMYPDRRHKGDSLDWNISARDALQKVLQDAGVDAFFAGHTHYARGDLIGGNVLQIQDGVPGSKAGTTGDPYRSMWFIHIATNGDLVITWKHNADSGSSWASPSVKTWTLPQGSIPITPPPQPGGTITVSTSAQLQTALASGGSFTIKNGNYTLNPVISPPGTIAIGESKEGVIISSSSTGYLITLKSNSIIDKCTFKHKGKTIFVSGPQTNWKVRNNHFVDSIIAVLAEDLTSGYPTAGNGSEISGNTGKGSKLSTMQGQYKLHVFDNEFHDRNGSEFLDINYNNDYCIIENNKLINGSGYTMSEEMIDAVGGNGHGQDNNIIRNNTIIGNFKSGIRPGITADNNTIEGNYIEWLPGPTTQEAGIYMYGKGGSSVPTGNKIIGNTIKGGNCGIKLSNADNNTISQNTISGAVRGIALVRDSIYGSDIAPNGNTVSKNTIVVSNMQNGIINEGQNTITPDNVITDTEPPLPPPGPGPVQFDLSNLAKVGMAIAGIYALIKGVGKK